MRDHATWGTSPVQRITQCAYTHVLTASWSGGKHEARANPPLQLFGHVEYDMEQSVLYNGQQYLDLRGAMTMRKSLQACC